MSAGAVSLIGLVNPVVGTLLGVAFAHEVFGTAQALGMVLVLGGVLLGQWRSTPAGRRTAGARGADRTREDCRLRGILRRPQV